MKKKLCLLKITFTAIIILISTIICGNIQNNNIVTDYIAINEPNINEITNETPKDIILNYQKKYNNDEIQGEISILNTNYKKAIVKHSDNDYYLDHTESKKSSFMGAIFLDFRIDINNGNKLLIFGHNSKNVSMPFEILENYYSEEYYNNHKYIKIVTNESIRLFKIYSVYVETSDFSYMRTDFTNKEDWLKHIKSFKEKSLYNTFEDVNEDDKILILQTCSTNKKYQKYKDKFLLVVAKEVK